MTSGKNRRKPLGSKLVKDILELISKDWSLKKQSVENKTLVPLGKTLFRGWKGNYRLGENVCKPHVWQKYLQYSNTSQNLTVENNSIRIWAKHTKDISWEIINKWKINSCKHVQALASKEM